MPMLALLAMLAAPQDLPKGAIALFDGKDASGWVQTDGQPCAWKVADGCMEVTAGSKSIRTKQVFGSYRLHAEFWLPYMPNAEGQGKANSGLYNQGRFEVQILDSYNNPTYPMGGCGALYAVKDPDHNAIVRPESWNTYDILFTAAKFDAAGKAIANPRISVWHNGIRIHNDVEIIEAAEYAKVNGPLVPTGPILLQNHGNPVRFRNIWIAPMEPKRMP